MDSSDKKIKRSVILSYLKSANPKEIQNAEVKLQNEVQKAKGKELKEDLIIVTAATIFGLQAGEALVVGLLTGIVLSAITAIITSIAVARSNAEDF